MAVWDRLSALWPALAHSFDHVTQDATQASEDSRLALALALGKLERNLVAGLLPHQEAAM